MFFYPDIDKKIIKIAETVLNDLKETYIRIDDICEANQYKVLNAFRKNKIALNHFSYQASGYGYDDSGRDKLEDVYSDVFHTEAALVRPQITCGTHAIYLALDANLLPGDELLYITGKPYDSLVSSIGEATLPFPNSLVEKGVSFKYVDLVGGREFDYPAIKNAITNKTKIIAIQRSKGYSKRASLSPVEIGRAVSFIKETRFDGIMMVDNCYGEFVSEYEPTDFGVDLCVGSLIKNPGGGLAPSGGYIIGKKALVDRCSFRLTAPGLGKEVGITFGLLRAFFQGLSFAPKVTAEALKTAYFAAAVFEKLGFSTSPRAGEVHNDIVQAIDFKNPDKLRAFCREIQRSSYVDSYVTPLDWDMPGYSDKIIMASGSFVSGSSIELSADGPMKEPYTAFLQGGLTHEQGRYAVMRAATVLSD